VDAVVDDGVNELAPLVGRRRACAALGRARATHYRRRGPHRPHPHPMGTAPGGSAGLHGAGLRADPANDGRRCPPRALSPAERDRVIEVLDSERFCDLAPAQVWATLLDEGTYLCSISIMYRLLRSRAEV